MLLIPLDATTSDFPSLLAPFFPPSIDGDGGSGKVYGFQNLFLK